MGLRFRRSVRLAPGVRLNFSKSGLSATIGPRGASVGIGRRGTFLNAGIPGTGLYARENLSGGPGRRSNAADSGVVMKGSVGVNDDGSLKITDDSGNPVPYEVMAKVKKQNAEAIKGLIENVCADLNAQVDALGEIHIYTPDPKTKPKYVPADFPVSSPTRPLPCQPTFLDKLFQSRRELVEQKNAVATAAFKQELQIWQSQKTAFEVEQAARRRLIEDEIFTSADAMERFLSENLGEIVWPRETLVTFEILDGGKRVTADVDLPEIEHLPNKTAAVPQRGLRLSIKEMSTTQHQKLYMRHVHGIGFRIIGETFAALPTVDVVVLSAYSQRADPATAVIQDQYLYSVRVVRDAWQKLKFDNLSAVDVVEALSQFELRRQMSKSGVFKPIEPFTA